ncbi:MAG: cytochrome c oxidase subunit II [Hyphomicrobiales bacterium]|nr:cytochrome c oxidase subunit II [Hyphomicrobiales bacterium]
MSNHKNGPFAGTIAKFAGAASALAGFGGGQAWAEGAEWYSGARHPASELMNDILWFESYTFWFIIPITLFVLALLIYCMVRFNARANPTPSKNSHNTTIEVIWTVVPIIILVMIAIPSFRLLYKQIEIPPADLTVKATGYQWYWGYEYPDHDGFSFDSVMLEDNERAPDQPRLLAVDNQVVVPVGKVVRVQVTAADVMHSFAMPSFGVKIDAIPGRLNETWFKAEREGLYYGQCSELCGINHAFMPIAIRVVSEEQFEKWVEAAKDDVEGANEMLKAMIAKDKKIDVARR